MLVGDPTVAESAMMKVNVNLVGQYAEFFNISILGRWHSRAVSAIHSNGSVWETEEIGQASLHQRRGQPRVQVCSPNIEALRKIPIWMQVPLAVGGRWGKSFFAWESRTAGAGISHQESPSHRTRGLDWGEDDIKWAEGKLSSSTTSTTSTFDSNQLSLAKLSRYPRLEKRGNCQRGLQRLGCWLVLNLPKFHLGAPTRRSSGAFFADALWLSFLW